MSTGSNSSLRRSPGLLLLVCLMVFGARPLAAQNTGPGFTRIFTGPIGTDVGSAHGCAWVDFDGDGFLDLFDPNYNIALQLPSYLYRNLGNGSFAKVTTGNLVKYIGMTVTGVWGDYDNDGYPDLFLPDETAHNFLYRNNGNGTFTELASGPIYEQRGGFSFNAAWSDYDSDGHLDLFVTGSIGPSPQALPGRNQLYHNNGDGSFSAVTNSLVVNDVTFCLGTAWADYDNDGRPDLFVVKGQGLSSKTSNRLYHNDGAAGFSRITNGPVATDLGNGLGCAWGDYNNDGFLDLFVPNEGGLRSFLYRNNGDGTFTKITEGVPVNTVAQSLAAVWGDYDNDGYLDLYVANGRDQASVNFLYRNQGDGTFARVTGIAPTRDSGLWHGAAWGDYDNDGFLDLFAANWGTQNALYRNQGNSNAWLKIKCVGTHSNRDAVGAKVRVRAVIGGQPRWQIREISAGDGIVQNSIVAHFGLGDATNVDLVRIEWPSGVTQELRDLAPRKFLTVKEPPKLVPGRRGGEFELRGGKGAVYQLEASADLARWTSVGRVTNAQTSTAFADPEAARLPRRFYRAFAP